MALNLGDYSPRLSPTFTFNNHNPPLRFSDLEHLVHHLFRTSRIRVSRLSFDRTYDIVFYLFRNIDTLLFLEVDTMQTHLRYVYHYISIM